jgi:hypothetical protein
MGSTKLYWNLRFLPSFFNTGPRSPCENLSRCLIYASIFTGFCHLTMRMSMRRFTRLTNAFSKKIQNHAAMVAIHAVHYNFARIHKTLRITPAMAAGLSDHVWSLEEIVQMADSYAPAPKPRGPYKRNHAA